jgi:tetratricopeptide (TPR) repeat protein
VAPARPEPVPPPRQLPADVVGFVGRTTELNTLDAWLAAGEGDTAPTAVGVVAGTAGVGKTALALRWAHRVVDRFPDGQFYVDLRGYDPQDPVPADDALTGFLRALGVAAAAVPPEPAERAALFRTLVAGRRLLVVLDNAADAEQVRPLLPGGAGCVTLVTSRDRLSGLVARTGAHRVDLPLLPDQDAVDLLTRLVGDRVPADPAAAVTLARRCAGLPLALRIAAEYLAANPATSPAELTGELADEQRRLDILNAGGDARTAVRAVLSWSYRGLEPAAARAFRLLGRNPGADVDRHALAALADVGPAEAARLLDRLGGAHLVHETAPGRYALHDLLRAYAGELADADGTAEPDAAVGRLLDHYVAAAAAAADALSPHDRYGRPTAVSGPGRPDLGEPAAARAWLDANRANLVAASGLAAVVAPDRAVALSAVLWRYFDEGAHFIDALAVDARALRAAIDLGDPRAEAMIRRNRSSALRRCGRLAEAIEEAGRALELFTAAADHRGTARALCLLAAVHWQVGEYDAALDCAHRARALLIEVDDPPALGIALSNLAGVYERRGDYDRALHHARAALVIFTRIGDRVGAARTCGNIGAIYERLGRYEEALDHHRRCLAAFADAGVRTFDGEAMGNLARVYVRLGRHDEAVRASRRGVTASRAVGDLEGEVAALDDLATAHLLRGDPATGATHYREAMRLAVTMGDRSRQASAHNGLAAALHALGRADDARSHHRAALALAREIGDRLNTARAEAGLGELAGAAGDRSRARRHWRAALSGYEHLSAPEADAVRKRLAERRGQADPRQTAAPGARTR